MNVLQNKALSPSKVIVYLGKVFAGLRKVVSPLFFVSLTVSPLTLHQAWHLANRVLVPGYEQPLPLHTTLQVGLEKRDVTQIPPAAT